MAYKTISLLLFSSEPDEGLLSGAVALAQKWSARLEIHCLGIHSTGYEAVPLGATATLVDAGVDDARAIAHEMAEEIQVLLKDRDVSYVVTPKVVHSTNMVSSLAVLTRYSDLILLRPPYAAKATDLDVVAFEAALFGTSAPVMILPHAANAEPSFRKIVIAWNESEEALNAVRAAMPVLEKADEVEILLIDPSGNSAERSDPGGSLSTMLLGHGVKSHVAVVSRKQMRVSEVLRKHAAQCGAGLIVMGGYGRSRLREAIFGGVTREMLGDSDVAVLMAH